MWNAPTLPKKLLPLVFAATPVTEVATANNYMPSSPDASTVSNHILPNKCVGKIVMHLFCDTYGRLIVYFLKTSCLDPTPH